MPKQVRVLPHLFAMLVAGLQEEALDYFEMADLTGLHNRTIRDWVHALHDRKLVHIAEWHPDSRGFPLKPAFRWGKGVDAARGALTRAELARRYRRKQKAIKINHMMAGVTRNATDEIPAG
jgi:hypothetical protein